MPKTLKTDKVEHSDKIVIEVEVPGYISKDISVEVQPYTYSLSYASGTVKVLSIEANNEARGRGTVSYLFYSDLVDVEGIEAKTENGILTVIMPYKPKHRNHTIPVS